jgi:phenylacetaldehyde dehydrogenase
MTMFEQEPIYDIPGLSPAARSFLDRDKRLFIGGTWTAAAGGRRTDIIDPSTGRKIAEAARGTAADVDRAVQAAQRALDNPAWRRMQPADRERLMHRLADYIEAHAEELSELEAIDVGMPRLAAQRFEIGNVLATLRYMAGWPTKIAGQTIDIGSPVAGSDVFAYTRREPVGVVAAILPWNAPLMLAMWKLAPILATGCTAVLKPSEITPLATLRLAELCQEIGLPDGVLNVVTGDGGDVGHALVTHPGVSKITFTGSVTTGRAIGRAAGENLKRVTLELGGKSPVLLLNDADLSQAIPAIAMGIYANSGQTCVAGSRLYVEREIYGEVVARLAAHAEGLRLGPGLQADTDLGPVASAAHRDRIVAYIDAAVQSGGQAIAGGTAVDGAGFFVRPTVLTGLPQTAPAVQEEIFGPVVTVIPFEGSEQAVRLANDTTYGLSSYIWGRDLGRVLGLVPRIVAGNVFVNTAPFPHPAIPFGGVRESGVGKDLGEEAVRQYSETKSVLVAYNVQGAAGAV